MFRLPTESHVNRFYIISYFALLFYKNDHKRIILAYNYVLAEYVERSLLNTSHKNQMEILCGLNRTYLKIQARSVMCVNIPTLNTKSSDLQTNYVRPHLHIRDNLWLNYAVWEPSFQALDHPNTGRFDEQVQYMTLELTITVTSTRRVYLAFKVSFYNGLWHVQASREITRSKNHFMMHYTWRIAARISDEI